MTDEQLLTKIAEWMGWEYIPADEYGDATLDDGERFWWPQKYRDDCQPLLERLREMDGETVFKFSMALDKRRCVRAADNGLSWFVVDILCCTPRQICEALVAAIGGGE